MTNLLVRLKCVYKFLGHILHVQVCSVIVSTENCWKPHQPMHLFSMLLDVITSPMPWSWFNQFSSMEGLTTQGITYEWWIMYGHLGKNGFRYAYWQHSDMWRLDYLRETETTEVCILVGLRGYYVSEKCAMGLFRGAFFLNELKPLFRGPSPRIRHSF